MRVLVPLKQGDEESEDYNNRKQKQKNGKSKRESPKEAASKQAPDTATNKAAKKRKLRDDTRHTGSALPAASASSTPGEDKGCTVIKEGNGDHHHPEQASNPSSSKDPPKLGGGAAVAVAVSFEDSAVATASTVTAAATAAASVAVTHDRHNNSNSNTESKERHEQEQEQENVVGGKKDQPNTASSPPSPPPTTANQEAPKSTLLQRNTDRKDRKAEATGETEIDIEPEPIRKPAAVNDPDEQVVASATLGSAASPNTGTDTDTNSSVPNSTSSSKGQSRNTAESPRQQLRLPRQRNENDNDTPNHYDVGSHEIPAPAKLKLATHREHCATETGAATSATATATTTATANQASVAASFATEKPLKLPPPPVATTQTAAAASTTTTNQKETSQHGTDVTAERDRKRKALPKRTSESVRKASSICSLKDSPVVKRAKRKETGHSASHHRSNETATAIRAAPCGTSELTAKQLPTRSSTRLAPAHSSLSLPLPLPLTANQSSIPAAAATNTSKPAPSIALAAGSSTTRSAANRHHSKQSQHSYASNPETRKHTRCFNTEGVQKNNKKKPPAAEAPQPINPGDLKPAARRSTRISKRSTSTLSITSNHNSGNINHSSSISNKNDNMGLYVRRPSSERDDDYRDMPEHDAPNTPSTRSSASSSASGSAHHRMDPYHHQHHPDSIIHHHAHDDPTTMTSTDARDHTVPNEDFVLELKKSGLEIREQDGDGNCLFRAISLQIYGDPSMHDDVRKQCLDFMERDQEHFAQFVTGEPFEEYVQRKRKDGVHGNNPEIQAISELFNRPVEVYCPENGAQPINIFHADYKTGDAPIRLSYHDGNHYNAVVDPLVPTAGLGLGLPDLQPGLADRMQVAKAVAESDKAADQEHLQKVMKKSEDDELQRAIKESSLSVEHMYNKQAMNLSDVDATYFEMEQAVLEQSLRDQGHTDASAAALASLKLQATDSKPAETKRSAISPAPTTHRHMMTRSSSVASGVAAASVAARTPIRPVSMIDGTAAVRLGNNNDMIGTSRNRDRNSRQPAMDAATVVTNGSGSGISSSASAAAMHPSAAAASVASMPSAASAMASSMDDASTSTSLMSMAADQEYPETVQELAMNGFPLQKVIKAYELLGDNFDELLVFLMSTTSETSATSGAASGATGSS